MPLYYVAQQLNRFDDNVAARIERSVEAADEPSLCRHRFSRPIPKAGNRGGGLTRYLLLLIDADGPREATALAGPILQAARRNGGYVANGEPLTFPEAQRGQFVDDGTHLLAPTAGDDAGDPFNDLPDGPGGGNASWPACDRLLEWMTAVGSGRWEMYVRVARRLGAAATPGEAGWLFRRLRLLSHVEASADGAKWCITPPSLVKSPASADLFACGGRTESMRRLLIAIDQNQPDGPAPSCWEVHGPVEELGAPPFVGEAAAALASHMPDGRSWPAMVLQPVPHLNPPSLAERWTGGGYEPETALRIGGGRPQRGPAGLYRLSYEEGRPRRLTAFLDPLSGDMWRGDWESLRFLTLRARANPPAARSLRHEGRQWLVVPRSDRWPLLHERVLVLCSGLLPRRQGDLLWYRDVTAEVAGVLCARLGVHHSIEA